MALIDIGVNLMNAAFDRDREAVAAAAEAAGVSPLVITGSSGESSLRAAEYAARCPGKLYATAGVHPHNARFWEAAAREQIRSLAARPGAAEAVVAVGECGLDYNRDYSPRDRQRECFEAQIDLAAELGKPLFLHERDAFADFFAILKKRRADICRMVVHCFTGGEGELEAYLALDAYIGLTGWICDERRGRHLIPLVKKIPPDKLLLETDAPYLTPRNMPGRQRNGRNEPANLVHIAAFIAGILGKDAETLAAETSANSRRFFALDA
ncbi:MAG: TatD family hydrolase [Treponema sp.]|nr:TatD family hydrolase [Treponema sp.]